MTLETDRVTIIFGVSITLMGLGSALRSTDYGLLSSCFIILGLYAMYRGILELTSNPQGFSMPNAYKVLIAVMVLLTINHIANSYVTASFWNNFALNFDDNINAIVDNIIRLIEYFKAPPTGGVI